jgi:hypothetical protein
LVYFHSAEVQQILEDILFLYCRIHPHQEYAQDWHELARFLFSICHSLYVADAYFTFVALAESLETISEASTDGDSYCGQFATGIQTTLLVRHSPDLARAVNHAGVPRQSYKVQWLRLLFVRTLGLRDTADFWDLILAHLPSYAVIENTCIARSRRDWRSGIFVSISSHCPRR